MTSRKSTSSKPPDPTEADVIISKSQSKREAQAIKTLAIELIALRDAQLKLMPLEPDTLEAVRDARAITSNVARKRQMLFVAKLLRRSDPAAIEQAIETLRSESRQVAAQQHRAEDWRDRLVHDGDRALSELMEHRPELDAQAMRQWIRAARRELAAGKPPAAARNLFRALRDLDRQNPLPAISKAPTGPD